MKQFKDPAMQQYFDTLPAYIQESVIQSGVQMNTLEQLRKAAENLTAGK